MQDEDTGGSAAGGGYIAGIGYISGVRCVVAVDDYLIKGGHQPHGRQKRIRMLQIALENKLPMVNSAERRGEPQFSRGHLRRVRHPLCYAMPVVSGRHTTDNRCSRVPRSGAISPPCLTPHSGAQASTMYWRGRRVLKAATGEIATEEDLGGAEMHSEIAGTNDYLAENDAGGFALRARSPRNWAGTRTAPPGQHRLSQPCIRPRSYAACARGPNPIRYTKSLPASPTARFSEFKGEFDSGTLCGHIEIEGSPCGVIGNNSPLPLKARPKRRSSSSCASNPGRRCCS
ncbi:MAG: hypothetical protein CM15mP74_33950 [Halieaceae bacterium]|nr:MAG: hypothetical protein CM15mP74_33950 [Halieaceae bacterium]